MKMYSIHYILQRVHSMQMWAAHRRVLVTLSLLMCLPDMAISPGKFSVSIIQPPCDVHSSHIPEKFNAY